MTRTVPSSCIESASERSRRRQPSHGATSTRVVQGGFGRVVAGCDRAGGSGRLVSWWRRRLVRPKHGPEPRLRSLPANRRRGPHVRD